MEQEKSNLIALILSIAGYIVLVAGLAAGLYLGMELSATTQTGGMMVSAPHPLRWVYGGVTMAFSVITGLLLVGFGENLKLLHRLVNK